MSVRLANRSGSWGESATMTTTKTAQANMTPRGRSFHREALNAICNSSERGHFLNVKGLFSDDNLLCFVCTLKTTILLTLCQNEIPICELSLLIAIVTSNWAVLLVR